MTTPDIPPSIKDPSKRMVVKPVLTAHNDAKLRTEIQTRHLNMLVDEPKEKGGSDLAPTPLETALGALIGCEAVVMRMVATAIDFDYDSVDFECEGEADLRGARGVKGIRPYFETVRLKIKVTTDESESRLDLLRRNVEHRCPIMNLFKDAGVEMEIDWIAVPRS
ncbi:OsmC family protein [Celeribacter sp.]